MKLYFVMPSLIWVVTEKHIEQKTFSIYWYILWALSYMLIELDIDFKNLFNSPATRRDIDLLTLGYGTWIEY